MTDWTALDSSRAALAAEVGPFPHRAFLEVWWHHHGSGTLLIGDEGGSAWAFVLGGGTLRVAGDEVLTDYHSPLGADPSELVASMVDGLPSGTRLRIDSLPLEAAEPVAKAIERAGIDAVSTATDHTMVLHLEADDPLDLLDRKQRHEVRRKERRFADRLGPASLDTDHRWFEDFVTMHRSSPGDKGRFMTAAMADFFSDLLGVVPGARLDTLVTADGRAVASAFAFEDDRAYYLYNSSFDPAAAAASPGIVLLHRLIERASTAGLARFDFLKGAEPYKRRLGAVPRTLYTIEGVV